MTTLEKVILNNDVLADCTGKVNDKSVAESLPRFKAEDYRGKHVVMKGCAPTWAVMMIQHRLEGVAAKLSFALYDGKEYDVW